ncbi:Tat pathway signal sequence protein [Rutstroemia sp. NJR-2017a BVV2]|nr:Tat pathway signal sequence protein [Rutstroemia sp. NJR-2017a BVV2]
MESDSESEVSFQSYSHHDEYNKRSPLAQYTRHVNISWVLCLASFLGAYFLVTITIMLILLSRGFNISNPRVPSIPYSPANTAVGYTVQKSAVVEDLGDSVFASAPSDKASFKAWMDLVYPTLIRLTYDEMLLAQESPEESVEVKGGGYMGSLGVYHELHCLRRLKLHIYKTDVPPAYELYHLNHCIEVIRLSLMCAGNTALYTFEWVGNETKPRTKTNSQRVCVDFAAIEAWSKEREIGFSPVLVGPEWRDGN